MTEYLRPIPVADPAALPESLPLAGGALRFAWVEVLSRDAPPEVRPAAAFDRADLEPLTAPRQPIAGLSLDVPRLMGILNITPDSFSDGGRNAEVGAARRRAAQILAEGADLIDIGGESTRPGAAPVAPADEIARVAPVAAALARDGIGAPLSLDTRNAATARAVPAAILNDVSGLRHDPDLARVAAETGAALILAHSIGTPGTMQDLAEGAYRDVLLDAYDALGAAIAEAEAAGVPRGRIMVDPGIGFGKTLDQNLALIARVSLFHGLGCGVLLGVSRKGMIGRLAGVPEADRRGPGSAGIGLWAVSQGIQMLRVHDMGMHAQMLRSWRAGAGLRPETGR